ncbi:toxin-antitoxin system HicB family antitoxin [Roseospira navarrensis]|uniref:Toxin-antitoxin system HicB family antitoxin n=2 Tax=Roseospira navarrensis TaxID=140058 RepID=A0A7X1ZDH6_9PROT|nr:toxin-antitoxin system HicB family antitoxin [Roseospira navarrensis]
MTIHVSDGTRQRLEDLARRRGTSIDRLIDDMATEMLAEADAEARFQARAMRGAGRAAEGLRLLARARDAAGEA